MMETFGWRSSRQSPLTIREEEATVLQPAIIANGTLGRRFTRLSDDSAFTELALQDQPASDLVNRVFVRVLTRQPDSEERSAFVSSGLVPDFAKKDVARCVYQCGKPEHI